MKPTSQILAIFLFACAVAAFAARTAAQSPSPQQAPSQQQPPATAAKPSVQEINDAFQERQLKLIAGREKEPAEKVFKNIQIMKQAPAQRFLVIMNYGYSRALGVTCTHCHVENDFSSDEKRPKRAAREMAAMHRSINEQLNKMENLLPAPQGRYINCSTCHRGQINPIAESK